MAVTLARPLLLLSLFAFHLTLGQDIPLHLLQQTSNVSSEAEFLAKFIHRTPGGVHTAEEDLIFSESGSFNPGGVDLIADMMVDADNCHPKPTTIAIVQAETEPGVILFPQCTRVMRCGGCCGHDSLECVPVRVQRVNVKVLRARYEHGTDQFNFEGLVDHLLEEHSECECRCRVQSYHCDPAKHIYNRDVCQCQCLNSDDAISCPSAKVWNEAECACVCPRIPNCLHDEFFNFATCSCERSTSGQVYTTSRPAAAEPDPCRSVYCRPGWQPVVGSDGRCSCRIASRRLARRSQPQHWGP